MNRKIATAVLCLGLLVGGVAAAQGGQPAVHGCVGNVTEMVRVVDEPESCHPLETARSWSSEASTGRAARTVQFRSITTDYQPHAPTIGPYTPINFHPETVDAVGSFDAATGSFVAASAGVYTFVSRVIATGTQGVYELVFLVNGVNEAWVDIQTKSDTSEFVALSGRTRRTLAAGDRVQLAFQSSASVAAIGRSTSSAEYPAYSIFSGYKTG